MTFTQVCVFTGTMLLSGTTVCFHIWQHTRPRFLWAQPPPPFSNAHTNYFRKTIKALTFVLVVHLNLNEPFSSTVPAPKLIHHQEQNIGWMRGLQRVGHLYKAVIWASQAATNRDTHGHQPQSAFPMACEWEGNYSLYGRTIQTDWKKCRTTYKRQ